MCRHWRRTFIERADLWSKLFLSNGEVYTKTFLERAKGAALDTFVRDEVSLATMEMLSSHTEQIKYLNFVQSRWANIQNFSKLNPGPLPLLRTLGIGISSGDNLDGFDRTPPSPPLFNNAVNLESLVLHSDAQLTPFLTHFAFPNLVAFNLSANPSEGFRASLLLDFLEASPTLQAVDVTIIATMSLERVPQQRVVVLPNVKIFGLTVNDGGPGYRVATHISCPSARTTLLSHRITIFNIDGVPEEVFPASVPWSAIVHQYSSSPVKRVSLVIKSLPVITCILTFRSLDATVIELRFKVAMTDYEDEDEDEDEGGWDPASEELFNGVFTQAIRTIRNHPQLPRVRHLSLFHGFVYVASPSQVLHMASEMEQLFKSLGPLHKVILNWDLRQYFHPFLDSPDGHVGDPVVFPQTKRLTVCHPVELSDEECTMAIVGLARSQHALGIPFERVLILGKGMPAGMEEGLKPWVRSVEYRYGKPYGTDDE